MTVGCAQQILLALGVVSRYSALPMVANATANGGGSSSSLTVSITTTVPNTILVAIIATDQVTSASVASVTTSGLTWAKRGGIKFTASYPGENLDLEVWWAAAPSAGTYSVAVATSGSGTFDGLNMHIVAVSGVASSTTPWDPHSGLPATASYNSATTAVVPSVGSVSTSDINTFTIGAAFSAGYSMSNGTINSVTMTAIADTFNSGATYSDGMASGYLAETSALSGITVSFGSTARDWVILVDALAG